MAGHFVGGSIVWGRNCLAKTISVETPLPSRHGAVAVLES